MQHSGAAGRYPWLGFSMEGAFAQGWRLMSDRYALMLGLVGIQLGWGVVSWIIGAGFDMVGRQAGGESAGAVLRGLWSLVSSLVVTVPLTVGTSYASVCARRGEVVGGEQIFRGFACLPRLWLLYLLMVCAAMVVMIPAAVLAIPGIVVAAAAKVWPLGVAWGVLVAICLVCALVYLFARLYLAYLLAVDPRVGDLSALEAFQRSWAWTGPKVSSVVGLVLLLGLLTVASLLMCGLPYIFLVGPWAMGVGAAAYTQLCTDAGAMPEHGRCVACGAAFESASAERCGACGVVRGVRGPAAGAGS